MIGGISSASPACGSAPARSTAPSHAWSSAAGSGPWIPPTAAGPIRHHRRGPRVSPGATGHRPRGEDRHPKAEARMRQLIRWTLRLSRPVARPLWRGVARLYRNIQPQWKDLFNVFRRSTPNADDNLQFREVSVGRGSGRRAAGGRVCLSDSGPLRFDCRDANQPGGG